MTLSRKLMESQVVMRRTKSAMVITGGTPTHTNAYVKCLR